MFQSLDFDFVVACWGLFLLVWGLGWIYNLVKAPPAEKKSFSALTPPIMLVVFLIFLVVRWLDISLLAPLLSLPGWLTLAGAGLLALSTGLTLWARFVLGAMWSSQPMAKVGHQLRTDGPYQVSRHPIYTGLMGMALSSLLAGGFAPFWFLIVAAVIVILVFKIPSEEKLMLATFGEQYVQYQQRVPQLIPGLRWLEMSPSGAKDK